MTHHGTQERETLKVGCEVLEELEPYVTWAVIVAISDADM